MILKRISAVLLAAAIGCTAACGCAETYHMAGFDGDASTESVHNWEGHSFFERMEARTGTDFTFSEYTSSSDWQAAKQSMLTGGELPDVLFKAALTRSEAIAMDEAGLLVDLLPLLPEYAPNLWALLEEHPDWLSRITLPSGHVAALPAINPLPAQNAMWINRQWLETLKLDVPTDLSSLHDVLVAFRDQDPNQNGKKDEIPLEFSGPWDLKFLSHAVGAVADDYNLYLDDTNIVRFWPYEDSFYELANTLAGWYREGLLDENGFTVGDSLRRLSDDDSALTFGMVFGPTPLNMVTYTMGNSFDCLMPLTSANVPVYRDLVGCVTEGAFAITTACENPGELLRWADILYTEEGAIEAMMGIEDEDWEWDEDDGTWMWVGGESAMDANQLSALTLYDSGTMPWLFPQDFYDHFDNQNVVNFSKQLNMLQETVKRPMPYLTLNSEDRAKAVEIQNKLGTYVDELFARIILGEMPAEEADIAAYKAEMEALGAGELTEIFQNAVNAMP